MPDKPLTDEQEWERVWREMSDAELERSLRNYEWLAANTPNAHRRRLAQIRAEWERRLAPGLKTGMESRMKESYREGVANHSGPEPCEGSRKAVLEALDRGICRLGIELRNQWFRKPMASSHQKATRLRAVAR